MTCTSCSRSGENRPERITILSYIYFLQKSQNNRDKGQSPAISQSYLYYPLPQQIRILYFFSPIPEYNVQLFILKIIVNQSMLLRVSKQSTKSKAVSSYMLSGINIKRMIQDEIAENNVSDISIIRVSKRPIFKLKERAEKEKENSVAASLPNKSFKIRSYTRKMKDGKEEESCEMFEKVEKVRSRVSSNRLELFNLSKENREKDENEQRIQTKIKEILQREATIKCKPITTQVFVKQPSTKMANGPVLNYQQFSTQKYRETAHKVNAYFNPNFQERNQKHVLLVISMEALTIQSRKALKHVGGEDGSSKQGFFSQEQIQLLKMVSNKHYPDHFWANTKVAFKVNTSAQLQDLKLVLENNHISDYYCIFYPIKKYVQCWNLYQIDGLLQNTHSLILLQAKYKLKQEFPILHPSIEALFISTNYDSLVTLSRTIAAIKHFLTEKTQVSTILHTDEGIHEEDDEDKEKVEEQAKIPEFAIRDEAIDINWTELDARLDFVLNSRELKCSNSRHQNKSVCTSKDTRGKRRVLCDRDSNCPVGLIKDHHRNLNFNSASVEVDKWEVEIVKPESIDAMRESLLYCMRTERLKEVLGNNRPIPRKGDSMEKGDKCDELEEITSYVRGSCCRSKTHHQLISELLKKNTAIHRQIEQYSASIAHLPRLNNPPSYNVSVSIFNEPHQEHPPTPTLHAFKIL